MCSRKGVFSRIEYLMCVAVPISISNVNGIKNHVDQIGLNRRLRVTISSYEGEREMF